MIEFDEIKKKANYQYDVAYHLLTVTYPMIKEPKLLMSILSNIANALEYGMDAILIHERQLKLVPPPPTSFIGKLNVFRHRSLRRNNVSNKMPNLIMELKEILELQKKCPTQFQRGNKFIVCTKDYQMKVISLKEVKEYLEETKKFLKVLETLTEKFKTKKTLPI